MPEPNALAVTPVLPATLLKESITPSREMVFTSNVTPLIYTEADVVEVEVKSVPRITLGAAVAVTPVREVLRLIAAAIGHQS